MNKLVKINMFKMKLFVENIHSVNDLNALNKVETKELVGQNSYYKNDLHVLNKFTRKELLCKNVSYENDLF